MRVLLVCGGVLLGSVVWWNIRHQIRATTKNVNMTDTKTDTEEVFEGEEPSIPEQVLHLQRQYITLLAYDKQSLANPKLPSNLDEKSDVICAIALLRKKLTPEQQQTYDTAFESIEKLMGIHYLYL